MSTEAERELFRSRLLRWGKENRRDFPWRRTNDPYKILVTEILLQRTLAQKVVPVSEELFSRWSTLGELADADRDEVADVLEPLGLQNRRAKALVEIGGRLSQSGVPKNEEDLLELPFVGRYAANATLCFAFGEARAVVDVNVVRIYGRVFGFNWESDQDSHAWEFAEEMLPDDQAQEYNLALLDFGATVCTASNPACSVCPLSEMCEYFQTENAIQD